MPPVTESVGIHGESYALVPIRLATIERQKIRLDDEMWRSVMDATGQEFYFGIRDYSAGGDGFAAP